MRPRDGSLALAARTERVGQLRQGEDALPGVATDFLLPEAAEQAQVVLPDGPVVALLAELTHLAVVVQDQPRRADFLRLSQIPEESLGLPQIGAQPDLRGPALPAVPDDPVTGRPPLDAGKEQATNVQQQTLL